MEHTEIKKAVIRSQHCQRNWDLDKEIPQEDLDLILHAATQCPSKQNVAFYKVHFITNRDIIEAVHDQTEGFSANHEAGEFETNSQTLANLLIAFEEEDFAHARQEDNASWRNEQIDAFDGNKMTASHKKALTRDTFMAIGIAAGYVNLTSSMLGYGTGCCACFDEYAVAETIGAKNPIKLLMGVGFKNAGKNRRVHHKTDFVFPTKTKQPITVNHIG